MISRNKASQMKMIFTFIALGTVKLYGQAPPIGKYDTSNYPEDRKFINSILSFAISFSSFGKPCVNIDIPTNSLKTNIIPLKTVSLTFDELKFLISKINFYQS